MLSPQSLLKCHSEQSAKRVAEESPYFAVCEADRVRRVRSTSKSTQLMKERS